MDITNVQNTFTEYFNGLGQSINSTVSSAQQSNMLGLWLMVAVIVCIVWRVIEAVLVGAISRGKGYSFFGNFLLGLLLGKMALIYAAGRGVSYEHSCIMQDRLAMETAKEMYKLQRARERAQLGSVRKQED